MSTATPAVNEPTPAAADAAAWREHMLTRQPVFDAKQQTIGYEIQSAFDARSSSSSDAATTAKDVRACIHQLVCVTGLEELTRGQTLFMAFHPQNMISGDYQLLPASHTCLMIDDAQPIDAQLLMACAQAIRQGYGLAVEVTTSPSAPGHATSNDGWSELLSMATMLSVDFAQLMAMEMCRALVHKRSPNQRWLARNVNDRDQQAAATQLGFELMQGQFFCQPQSLATRSLATTQTAQLRLLCELNKPQLDFDLLEEIIKSDVSLTCQLLRYMNCAAMGVKQRITSVKQAMVLLGEKPLRQWGSLVAVTCLGKGHPPELLLTTLVRARFCETLGCRAGLKDDALDLFLTGLLSTLDVLLQMPMQAVLEKMPISRRVSQTLTGELGSDFGRIYKLACAAQRGAWHSVIELANVLHLTHHQIACEYYQTLQWTQGLFASEKAA